jgi:hypothetical protein
MGMMRGRGGIPGMGGGMGALPDMMKERVKELTETFKEKGAVSPETAMTSEELGLPPMFEMMQKRLGQKSAFIVLDGKYYLSEENAR